MFLSVSLKKNCVWVLPSLVSQRCFFFFLVCLSCHACYSFWACWLIPTHFFFFFHVHVVGKHPPPFSKSWRRKKQCPHILYIVAPFLHAMCVRTLQTDPVVIRCSRRFEKCDYLKKITIFHPLICSSYANCWGVTMLCVPFAGDRVCVWASPIARPLWSIKAVCSHRCLSDSFSFLSFFFYLFAFGDLILVITDAEKWHMWHCFTEQTSATFLCVCGESRFYAYFSYKRNAWTFYVRTFFHCGVRKKICL